MKKEQYIEIYKKELNKGHVFLKNEKQLDQDGDVIYRAYPEYMLKDAISSGWVKVSTVKPSGVPRIKTRVDLNDEILITKAAAEYSKVHDLDLTVVKGSGKNGKITMNDIKQTEDE